MAQDKKTAFSALFGVLYVFFGLMMIMAAIVPDLTEPAGRVVVPADPAGGFVLCVVGAVFLFSYRHLKAGSADGAAFLYMAMALSVLFGIVALLSLLAEGADLVLFGEGEPWDPAMLLVPMVWLAVIPAIGLYAWGRDFIGNLTGD